jgi:predicted transposase YbfD/YdcC
VLTDLTWLSQVHQCSGLKSLILTESSRTIRGQTSTDRSLYITSIFTPAAILRSAVRRHWALENKLHWVLDVTFREDQTRITDRNAALNLAIIRKLALNLQKRSSRLQTPSACRKKRRATQRVPYLISVLSAGTLKL